MKLLNFKNIKEDQSLLTLDLQKLFMSYGTNTILNKLSAQAIKNISRCLIKNLYSYMEYSVIKDRITNSYLISNAMYLKALATLFAFAPDKYTADPSINNLIDRDELKEKIPYGAQAIVNFISEPEFGWYVISLKNAVIIYLLTRENFKMDNANNTNPLFSSPRAIENRLRIFIIGKNHEEYFKKFNRYMNLFKPEKSTNNKPVEYISCLHYMDKNSSSDKFLYNALKAKYWDTLIIDNKKSIMNPINSFLSKQKLFNEREWQYCFNILFTGFAGTGKTSIIKIIQTYLCIILRYPVDNYCCKATEIDTIVSSIMENKKRRNTMDSPLTLVTIEEVDEVMNDESSRQTLMQFLDGTQSLSNCIVICTSNYPNRLDKRLFDRFHLVKDIQPLNRKGAEKLCTKLNENDFSILDNLKRYIPEHIKNRLLELNCYVPDMDYDSLLTFNDVENLLKNNNIQLPISIYDFLQGIDCYIPREINNIIRIRESMNLPNMTTKELHNIINNNHKSDQTNE